MILLLPFSSLSPQPFPTTVPDIPECQGWWGAGKLASRAVSILLQPRCIGSWSVLRTAAVAGWYPSLMPALRLTGNPEALSREEELTCCCCCYPWLRPAHGGSLAWGRSSCGALCSGLTGIAKAVLVVLRGVSGVGNGEDRTLQRGKEGRFLLSSGSQVT